MIEDLCAPCSPPEPFTPKPVDPVCPPPVVVKPPAPNMRTVRTFTEETDFYADLLFNMATKFACNPADVNPVIR